jgi:hypothetical protein
MKNFPFWAYLSRGQKASVVTAILGFGINFTITVTSGGVTVHRNWAPLILGILVVVLGLASAPGALENTEHKKEKVIAFIAAVFIGVIHIVRGLGVFYS